MRSEKEKEKKNKSEANFWLQLSSGTQFGISKMWQLIINYTFLGTLTLTLL